MNGCPACKALLAQAWPTVEKQYGKTYEIVKVEINTKDENYDQYERFIIGNSVPQIVVLDSEGARVSFGNIVGYENERFLMMQIEHGTPTHLN